jgi:hypothetical protein
VADIPESVFVDAARAQLAASTRVAVGEPIEATDDWHLATTLADATFRAAVESAYRAGQDSVRAHRCPANGLRTIRARDLAINSDPRLLAGQDAVSRSYLEQQVADDQALMREHHLCERCGYPLDGSAPHPEAMREPPADTGWAKTESVRDGERRARPEAAP